MTTIQQPTIRCACGRSVPVTVTASPYEFEWACGCGRSGVVSWAHASPPPTWRGVQYVAIPEGHQRAADRARRLFRLVPLTDTELGRDPDYGL